MFQHLKQVVSRQTARTGDPFAVVPDRKLLAVSGMTMCGGATNYQFRVELLVEESLGATGERLDGGGNFLRIDSDLTCGSLDFTRPDSASFANVSRLDTLHATPHPLLTGRADSLCGGPIEQLDGTVF
jgi:hypothetical protein